MSNPFELTDRHALVTGGGRGIGFGIAEAFAEAGARVTLLSRSTETLEASVAKLPGDNHGYVAADAGDLEGIPAMVDKAISDRGPLDILVNNAGTIRRGPAEELPVAEFEEVLKVNVSACFAFGQAFAKHRIENGGGGSIINIASLMSEVSRRNTAAYTASKGAVKMLTRNMAVEWAHVNMRANAIGPGFIRTDFTEPLQENEDFDSWVKGRTPLGRWGEPSDIGPLAVFLASDAASYLTGQIIYVDGGLLATM